MENDHDLDESLGIHVHHLDFKPYIIGFGLCIALTLLSFYLVSEHVFKGWNLILTLAGLGLVQVFVQLICFLHLGQEGRPYWNLQIFLFMLLVLLIIVLGTLWIMYELDYRVMDMTTL